MSDYGHGGASVDVINATHGGNLPFFAQQIADAHASRDREDLARLIREGRVTRDYSQNRTMRTEGETVDQFRKDIDGRVSGIRPAKNLAIKPKKRKRR